MKNSISRTTHEEVETMEEKSFPNMSREIKVCFRRKGALSVTVLKTLVYMEWLGCEWSG